MFIIKYMFPVLLLLSAGNSYADFKKENIERFYKSIVSVRSTVPAEARTASSLGVRREGNGVAINERNPPRNVQGQRITTPRALVRVRRMSISANRFR